MGDCDDNFFDEDAKNDKNLETKNKKASSFIEKEPKKIWAV